VVEGKWSFAMKNIMEIEGFQAKISYDPSLETFRGEFLDLNGGADFYGGTIEELRREGEISLRVFRELCEEDGVSPHKQFSGRFQLRLPASLHQKISMAAAAEDMSLNGWIKEKLQSNV
jgi:predicted HicB family RNase H-like nuclease